MKEQIKKMKIKRLRKKLQEQKLDAMLITNRANVRYLTGFTGSSGIAIITMNSGLLLTDFRYIEQANNETAGWQVIHTEKSLLKTIARILKKKSYSKIAFESNSVSFNFFQELCEELGIPKQNLAHLQYESVVVELARQKQSKLCHYNQHTEKGHSYVKLVPVKGWVEELRAVKTNSEISALRTAGKLIDDSFRYALGILKPGKTEREIAIELEYFIKKKKKADLSFDIILLSGSRTSLPHGKPSSKILRKQDLVLLDFGTLSDSYCSDLTRTICLGRMNSEQMKVYGVVLRTQKKALKILKPGIKASKPFSFARRMIQEAGYSLNHGLGHGLGLEIHEYPRIGSGTSDTIKRDMVVTVEPGIYLKGKFGIRIEDMVLVKENGVEFLTHSPREIIEL